MTIIIICDNCGKQKETYPCRIKEGGLHFCSHECHSDYIRGKPNPERAERYKGRFKGEENPNFKGDAVSYCGIHRWVYRNIPKPPKCSHCNTVPESGRMEAHNISGEYKRETDDWIWVCTKCHQEIDGRILTLRNNAKNHRDENGRLTAGCTKIIDAEADQKHRFKLRDEK